MRTAQWQIASLISPGAIAVPFVNDTRLLVRRGMTGATGNVYAGLHEYEEMAFCLHCLREGDLFVDVGANVGSYTVLAAGAVGATAICLEPVPSTFRSLRDNLRLNDLDQKVEAVMAALGAENGILRFTRPLDTTNHVATMTDTDVIDVPVRTLDDVCGDRTPTIVKMDVEGYELAVIAGGLMALARTDAVIAEIAGAGARYGSTDADVHSALTNLGLIACSYSPEHRRLEPVPQRTRRGNTIFVRDVERIRLRLKEAPSARVNGLLA